MVVLFLWCIGFMVYCFYDVLPIWIHKENLAWLPDQLHHEQLVDIMCDTLLIIPQKDHRHNEESFICWRSYGVLPAEITRPHLEP